MREAIRVLLYGIPLLVTGWAAMSGGWVAGKHGGYTLLYTAADRENVAEYASYLDEGITSVKEFFADSFRTSFDVYVHPDRRSLDSTWQKDWNMPGFSSECWMVASGVATRLDMISPKTWDTAACEHVYAETVRTRRLLTHELAHVFHGQRNASPDFSDTEGMDWFLEGLATYVSGQCDSARMAGVRAAAAADSVPPGLDDFWKGRLRYGLSGSMVMFIDRRYGRETLATLLPVNRRTDLLTKLNTTEAELLGKWRGFVLGGK